jgi:predicted dinucleotide-utilizing enzyme
MAVTVNLIGQGAIGGTVADWLRGTKGYHLQEVIRRGHDTWQPADLCIDTAGPDALRAFGLRMLRQGPLWTVGAAALIDPVFRQQMQAVAQSSGHHLRLFTPWITGPGLAPQSQAIRLHITQSAPNLGPTPGLLFEGPLAMAAPRFPDHLNTATAAALTGPGVEATTIRLISNAEENAPHRITSRFDMPGCQITTEVAFGNDGMHPVAAAIIAALERWGHWLSFG